VFWKVQATWIGIIVQHDDNARTLSPNGGTNLCTLMEMSWFNCPLIQEVLFEQAFYYLTLNVFMLKPVTII
jgi:hypothetical protein